MPKLFRQTISCDGTESQIFMVLLMDHNEWCSMLTHLLDEHQIYELTHVTVIYSGKTLACFVLFTECVLVGSVW